MKHIKTLIPAISLLLAAFLAGCGDSATSSETSVTTTDSVQPSVSFLLEKVPDNVTSLVSAVEAASPGDAIVVTGRVGGNLTPLSEDYAGFVMADESIYFCDEGDDAHCPTPWDACCEDPDKLAVSRAFVQFSNAQGDPYPVSLRQAIELSENDTVVVKGILSPDSAPGNPVILAEGLIIVN